MTIDLTTTRAHIGSEPVDALRTVLLGPDAPLRARVRAAVSALGDLPRSGLTYSEQAALAPDLLRSVIAALGGSGTAIATDVELRGILCEEAAVSAPRLLPVLTGHFDLAMGAVLSLGSGADYQQQCLAELDTGAALGALMLTELGGTNAAADHRTTARWDLASGGFLLSTPDIRAAKFMPNVGSDAPKIVLVTARVITDGRDQGVFAFLLKLRSSTGLAAGVEVELLPDKAFAPMDHAIIRFRDCWVPRQALLGGDWARIDANGRFECELPMGERFHRAVAGLGGGRLDLANASVASARAALTGLANFARQRGSRVRMADRDAVQANLVTGLVSLYTATILGRHLRDMRAGADGGDPDHALWSMLAKPALTHAAQWVLGMCRERTAAHGSLLINHLGDWAGNVLGARIAEGETQVLQKTAGRALLQRPPLQLPDTPLQLPWTVEILAERERIIADGLRRGDFTVAGPVLGADGAAIELATATAERVLATAPLIAASTVSDPFASDLLTTVGAAYALERIHARRGWYTDHPIRIGDEYQPPMTIAAELTRNHRVLVDHFPQLVAAFDIPDLPGAPLFASDYTKPYKTLTGWRDETFPGNYIHPDRSSDATESSKG
ncbi:acyl-CoA dehydrogenase family protein [Nocardia sp. NPDC049737]|uniref:acyl-CoA dehydrogenase family protein n=1 Tax=Nocardia sp. NPDC049737 TaxID=3154358 RepID=UPI0034274D49